MQKKKKKFNALFLLVQNYYRIFFHFFFIVHLFAKPFGESFVPQENGREIELCIKYGFHRRRKKIKQITEK